MSDRQKLRNLALEMMQVGSALMKSASEVLAQIPDPEKSDVHERVHKELSQAALLYSGLRIDRIPKRREYEFYWGVETVPFLTMDDRQVLDWASRGPGALALKIESDLVNREKRGESEGLEDRTEGESQE